MLDRQNHNRSGPGFSRRDFLKGSGAAVAATALATAGTEEAQAGAATAANVAPADASDVTLNVNGKSYTVKVEPRVTLLEVLRNDMNLTGAKEACDRTTCGSCTVIIDGKATYACARLAHECAGKKIMTAESLQADDAVVNGFRENDAMQCGYCTPGFVVATKAFVEKNPGASLKEIQSGLGGNICRCGTYAGITQCALDLVKKGGA